METQVPILTNRSIDAPDRAAAILAQSQQPSGCQPPRSPRMVIVSPTYQTIHLARPASVIRTAKRMQKILAQQAPAPQLPPTTPANTPRIVVLDPANPDVS
jgi:hypothetical protein